MDAAGFNANQFMLTRGYRVTQANMKLAESTLKPVSPRVLDQVDDENHASDNESLKLLYDLAGEEEKVLAQKTWYIEEIFTISAAGCQDTQILSKRFI